MGKGKKRALGLSLIFTILIFCLFQTGWAGPPAVGDKLPDFTLPAPKESGDRSYLGLTFLNRSFRIPELKAELVILQVFSMYCSYCQADAPHVNELYKLIEGNQALKGKVKIIGIGAGNSEFEAATFKKKYGIPFPLLADPDFRIHKILGEVRTPYFIGVKIQKDGSHRVILSRLGMINRADNFLTEIVKLADMK
ncbi:MAG: peroxiredoxin family protein [Syntrophales bacterium]|nr:peroxiredoxin family protein [Syntrophales bacterium]